MCKPISGQDKTFSLGSEELSCSYFIKKPSYCLDGLILLDIKRLVVDLFFQHLDYRS